MAGEKKIYDVPIFKNLSGTPPTPASGFWKLYPKSGSWYILDEFGVESLISSIPITTDYIPRGTGTSIADGTWHFEGNDLVPNVTGSNIGSDASPDQRIGTIYLASTLDYANDLTFVSGTENMRLTTGGKLGVGTATPNSSSLLDITSTTKGILVPRMTTTQRDAISIPAESLLIYNTTLLKYQYYTAGLSPDGWETIGVSGSIDGSGTTNRITKWSDSNSLTDGTWAFSGNAIYPVTDGSNIGLTGTNRVGTIFLASTLNYATDLIFSEAGSEKMRILSGGEVGIGTSAPLDLVHIAASTSKGLLITSGASSERAWIKQFTGFGGYMRLFKDDGTTIGFELASQGTRGYFNTGQNFAIGTSTDLGATLGVKGSGATFLTYSLKVQNSSLIEMVAIRDDGNVGIGTISPSYEVHLSKNKAGASVNIIAENTNATGWTNIGAFAGAQMYVGATGTTSGPPAFGVFTPANVGYLYGASSSNGLFIIQGANSYISFLTNGISSSYERMRIIASGDVGIGTSIPSAKLHVKGSGDTSATYGIQVHNSTGTNNALVVRDDGNVGIGTSIPSASSRLHIKGTGNSTLTGALVIQNSDNEYTLTYSDDYRFNTASLSIVHTLRLSAGLGCYGIQTYGRQVIGYSATDYIFGDGRAQLEFTTSGGSTSWYLGESSSSNLSFSVYGTGTPNDHVIEINKSNGYLGLGISNGTPSAKLHVKGSGATFATYGLQVHNSTGTNNALVVRDDGNVGIGTATPDSSSLLDITSTSKGMLVPRMTTAQRNSISSPAESLLIYNSTINKFQYYTSSISPDGWVMIESSVMGANTLQEVTDSGNTTNDDIEITDFTKGIILTAPNASRWRITVNNSGALITTSI